METLGAHAAAVSASSGSYFAPLMVSMVGIIFTTLAIVVYHFIVIRFCIRRRQRQIQMQLQANFLQDQPVSQANGVDEKLLSSIPILSYSTKNRDLFHVDQNECVVCLGDLEDGDLVRLLPNCKHVFHNPCIDKWFLGHTNCPVCRAPIAVPATIENDHELVDQGSEREPEEPAMNLASHPNDPEEGMISNTTTFTTSIQLPKPDNGLLRHSVSLVVLPRDENNRNQIATNPLHLERSLSLDHSHILIHIQRDFDDKPSSSSSSNSSKPVLTQCGSLKAISMRQFDRMSSVLVRSLSQLRRSSSQSSSTAVGNGIHLP